MYSEEKTDPAVKKTPSESSSSNTKSGTTPAIPSMPGAGIPANPFDFSSMAGLLNVLLLNPLSQKLTIPRYISSCTLAYSFVFLDICRIQV